MEIGKFKKAFRLFIIGQFFLLIGTINIGADFKVLPYWLSYFIVASLFGFVLILIATIKLYKVNKNYLRTLIALSIYLVISILADTCAHSKDDFYLIWSSHLAISADFILCILYVCFLLGTSDYLKEDNINQGNRKSKIGALVLVIIFIIERLLAFAASLNPVRLNVVAYSICKFGAWGLEFVIDAYVFVILVAIYYLIKKKEKEAITDEKAE